MKYIITAFVLGIIFAILVGNLINLNAKEIPFSLFSKNITEPSNSISEEQIKVLGDKIIINIKDASLSRYAPTGSMLPVLNENSNGIRIKVESEDEISIGDIITFKAEEGLIVHRVIEIGTDTTYVCENLRAAAAGKGPVYDISPLDVGRLFAEVNLANSAIKEAREKGIL